MYMFIHINISVNLSVVDTYISSSGAGAALGSLGENDHLRSALVVAMVDDFAVGWWLANG